MCPWGKTFLRRETEQMVKLSIQLRILACISQRQEKELMLENSLDKEGIVLQTQRLFRALLLALPVRKGAGLTAQAWNPSLITEQPCKAKCKLSMLPAKRSSPVLPGKGKGLQSLQRWEGAKPLQHRSTTDPAAREGELTCCPLVFAPHHLGEAELIHANLRRINLIQLLQFYSAQSAAQLPCEVICYLYTISLEILNSDQMVPCSHKPGFHYLILF